MKQIIRTIKSWFTSEIKLLHQDSASVIDVFTKTINNLSEVNTNIVNGIKSREATVAKLVEENSALAALKESHDKVITKLKGILED